MTVQEIIQAIRLDGLSVDGGVRRIQQFIEGLAEATELLEEVEQYRALGTVEEIEKKIQTELPYMSLAQARFKSELDEYRNIGTVEELKEAREKQIPKKIKVCKTPNTSFGKARTYYVCPNCGAKMCCDWKICVECGQALDWSDEE